MPAPADPSAIPPAGPGSPDYYRAALHHVQQGVGLVEVLFNRRGVARDYRLLEVNPAFERQTGLADAAGRTLRELAPALPARWFAPYGQVARTGQPRQFEQPAPLGPGRHQVHALPGGPVGSNRITILLAEATRPPSSQLLPDREAGAHTGSYEADLASGSCYFSDGLYRLFGEVPGAFAPTLALLDARSHPADVAPVRQVLGEATRTGQPHTYRRRIRRADGAWRTLEAHGEVRHDAAGRAVQLRGLVQDITERVQAEQALHESQALLRTTIDSSPDMVQVFEAVRDEQGVVVDFAWVLNNAAAERYYGDVIGQRLCQLNPGVVEEGIFDTFRQVLATGVPDQSERHYVHEQFNGWFHQSTVRLGDGVTTTTRDITGQKQAHEEILRLKDKLTQQATDKYHTLFYGMDQGFCVLDVLFDEAGARAIDFRYQEVNPSFARQAGMPEGVMGQTARALLPGLEPFWLDLYGQVALTGEARRTEHYVPQVSRWFDVHAFRVGAPGARQVAVLFSDITTRKHAEAQLRQAEERYRAQLTQQVAERTRQLQDSRDLLQSVLDTSLISMSVLYAVRDETGAVQDFRLGLVNKELERETGRTDLVGKLYAAEYPGIRQVGIFELMRQALATGEPQGMEYFYEYEGFNRWFTCQFVRLGDGVVATNLDITERKTAEQERLRNLRLLQQAEAVAGLGSWDYDLATSAMRWSDGMYHLFGLPLGQAVAPSHYLAAVLPDDRPRARQLVHRLTAGEGFEETLRLRVREQVKTVRMKAVVFRNDTGQPTRVLGVDLDISELQRLEADNLHLRLGQQQALFEAVQAAQEEERRRMAESLHNGLGQVLFATKLQLDRLDAQPGPPARHEAARLLSDAIRQTRALSHELSPALLEEFGLQVALETICQQLNAPSLRWHCHIAVANAPLPAVMQLAIYRLAQGLAHNVAQHAQASEATLEVERLPGWVVLRVEDNGRGFDPATVREGLGLQTLHSRAALLGGVVQLDSAPGQGTQVLVRLPVR